MNSFFEHHKDGIRWHYGCFDRILRLASPLPDNVGRRVAFVSSDHEDASATVAPLRKALALQPSKSARLQKAAARSRHGHRSCSRI
jgi:hypothetical protein